MPTREAYAVAILTLVVFFVALNLQAGWVYAVDALLAGFLVAGYCSARLSLRDISIRRAMPTEVGEGEPVVVSLNLTARGFGWRFFLEVRDGVPGLRPKDVFVPLLRPGRTVTAAYTTSAVRRGIYRVQTVGFRSGGLTGLFVVRGAQPAPGEITVFPRYWKLSRFPLAGWTPAPETMGATQRRRGLEFYGLRDYRPGDSVRHVHWRSSARRGSLMVREFEQEIPGSVSLLIDARPQVQTGGSPDGTFDDLVRAAASIAWFVTSRGGAVRLLADLGGIPLDVAGGFGQIMRALAEIEPQGTLSPAALLMRAVGLEASVILLTPDPAAIAGLAVADARVAAVLADAAFYGSASDGGAPGSSRTGMGAGHGIPVCMLRKGDDLGARLEDSDACVS